MTATRALSAALRSVTLAIIAVGISQPATAQLNQPLHRDGWLLAAVHAPGNQGSIWRTDLWILKRNPSASVTLYFCESDTDNTGATGFQVPAGGGQQVFYFEDVVDHFLHLQGGSWLGAIHYTASDEIQVWARVYSISPDGTRSYGQLVEGISTVDMSPDNEPWSSHDHQWILATRRTADGRYRVNVGVVNPTSVAAHYEVAIFNASGTRRGRVWVDVPPYSMAQLGDPFADVRDGEWFAYSIRVVCETEGGGTFAYASVVDNATNDAYFVRGVKELPVAPSGLNRSLHRDGWILAAAHAPGEQGSIWRTDLWIHVASPYDRKLTLYFCRAEQDGSTAEGYEVEIAEGVENYYFGDVVHEFLGSAGDSWLGSIHYVADTDIQVWARVYSISPDGTASYGQLIEGIPSADMSPDDEPYDQRQLQHLVAMKHTADDRFRVNIGVVNPTPMAASYELFVWSNIGQTTGTNNPVARIDLPPYSMQQLGDPLAAVSGGEWSDHQVSLRCKTDGAGGFLYASVVDNATNDAYFVRGIKMLTPGGE